MKPILVVYEDSALRADNFGPHRFLMALVADALVSVDPQVVRGHFRAFPKSGNDKVVDMLTSGPPTEAAETARGSQIVAVLDSDRVVELALRRCGETELRGVEAARLALERLAQQRSGENTFVRLLDGNVEALCAALGNQAPRGVSEQLLRDALAHDRASRDQVLAAYSARDHRGTRDAVLTNLPLLKATRDTLLDFVKPRLGLPS